MSMKNANDIIGNQTHELPACSAVPEPTGATSDLQLITRGHRDRPAHYLFCKCTVQFRVQRRVVDLESRYINLSMNGNLKQSSQLPLENSGLLSIPVENGWILSGQQAALLMNEDSAHIQILRSANIWMLNLYVRHNNKYPSVIKLQRNDQS